MIQTAIYESYYSGQTPVGVTHPKLFDPMPLEAMALVCAVASTSLFLYNY
jgi:hypothetical protein